MKAFNDGFAKTPLALSKRIRPAASSAARSRTKSPIATPTRRSGCSGVKNTP
ncbi:Uncharacterised protein [Mycobacterium tuberculosis]|nr:Uncharacterised protein [Mycobacterium tuberculosis]